MPETPRFYLSQNRIEETKNVFEIIAKFNRVPTPHRQANAGFSIIDSH